MPQFDTNAATQGIATGMAIPNKNTGMADVIKAITNDLRAAAASRQETMMKQQELHSGLAGELIKKGYMPGSKEAMDATINTGDISGWEKQTPDGMLGGLGMLGGGFRPKGATVNAQGETSYTYEAGLPTAETGKATLAMQAVQDLNDVKQILFPGGKFARGRAAYSAARNTPFVGGALPQTAASQNIYRKLFNAIAAKQLIQTGVAARPEETARLVKQYLADATSNPEATLAGFAELEAFYTQYVNALQTGNVPQFSGGAGGMLNPESGWIPMIKPDGTETEVAAESLQEAIAAGYRRK